MPGRHKPEETINLAAEEYELSTRDVEEPLLPQYEETEAEWRKPTKHQRQTHWCFRAAAVTLAALLGFAILAGSMSGDRAALHRLIGTTADDKNFPTK